MPNEPELSRAQDLTKKLKVCTFAPFQPEHLCMFLTLPQSDNFEMQRVSVMNSCMRTRQAQLPRVGGLRVCIVKLADPVRPCCDAPWDGLALSSDKPFPGNAGWCQRWTCLQLRAAGDEILNGYDGDGCLSNLTDYKHVHYTSG